MKVLVDDQVSHRLREIHEAVELRDSQGQVYGYYHPANVRNISLDGPLSSPFSEDELARRQAAVGGRPLAAIMKDLAGR